jgi:hypothetical protein
MRIGRPSKLAADCRSSIWLGAADVTAGAGSQSGNATDEYRPYCSSYRSSAKSRAAGHRTGISMGRPNPARYEQSAAINGSLGRSLLLASH